VEKRVFNFSAGPSILPVPVLEKAREELHSFHGIGMSVMEISHRSAHFEAVLNAAENSIRDLLAIPATYRILFLQGGASLQFSMVPMNFLTPDRSADYIITGVWGKKALPEALRCGNVNVIYSSEEEGFRTVPAQDQLRFTGKAAYVHYTSNETIDGVEFSYDLDGDGIPVICDASSNILSKPIDVEKYSFIYAGAQKNIGPSGLTIVIIRDDMLDKIPKDQHSMLDYRHIAENGSMANTPNTWAIYLTGLVCNWLRDQGGVAAIENRNIEKAAILYDAIDSSDGYYVGRATRDARSRMNVTFGLPSPDLDEKFVVEATSAGLDGLKGHRSVGGIRASIYNAFPREGVERLVEFMKDFSSRNA
jgi:phosphoserine aminotransferase